MWIGEMRRRIETVTPEDELRHRITSMNVFISSVQVKYSISLWVIKKFNQKT